MAATATETMATAASVAAAALGKTGGSQKEGQEHDMQTAHKQLLAH
jgi:hypothetical protein